MLDAETWPLTQPWVEFGLLCLFTTHFHVAWAGGVILLLVLLPTALAGKSCLLKTHFCYKSKCKASPWHQQWQWRLLERTCALFRLLLRAITGTWMISLCLWMYNFRRKLLLKAPLGHGSHLGHTTPRYVSAHKRRAGSLQLSLVLVCRLWSVWKVCSFACSMKRGRASCPLLRAWNYWVLNGKNILEGLTLY